MGKNDNKKKTKSLNHKDFSKNDVYCNYFMLKTVFIVVVLKIKQYKKDTFGNFWQIKVQYVPGLRLSTQCSFSANPTVLLATTAVTSIIPSPILVQAVITVGETGPTILQTLFFRRCPPLWSATVLFRGGCGGGGGGSS